jgi:nitroreductase
METDLAPTDDMTEIERRLAMPLVEAMTTQKAVRRVRPDPVDLRIVRRCVELALEGPTGSNGQNWEFVVVTERAAKERLAVQYRRAWSLYGRAGERLRGDDPQTARILRSVQWQVEHFVEIPVLVVACLKGGGKVPYVPMPAVASSSHYGSIYPSVQNLLLAARAVGLGASLITLPLWSTTVARRVLGLPLSVEPCCVVPLGWPIGRYGPKPRRPVDDVLHLDRYGTALVAE